MTLAIQSGEVAGGFFACSLSCFVLSCLVWPRVVKNYVSFGNFLFHVSAGVIILMALLSARMWKENYFGMWKEKTF